MQVQDSKQNIPEDILESLRTYGGIGGLRGLLQDEGALAEKAALYSAVSDPIRLKILTLLSVRPLCVCVVREVLGIADSRLSYHLSILKNVEFIRGEKQGNRIIYHITEKGRHWLAA